MFIPISRSIILVVLIFQTANVVTGQGGPCRGSPSRCYPTGDIKAGTTCITTAEIGNGTNWYQMENVCKHNNGRLVWLREDLDLEHLLYTSVKHMHVHGALVATGLLSSTADSAGLFWRNPSDYTTFECCNTVTKPCLYNSTSETCTATGCCWTNGQCQYPQNQTLSTFNANTSQMKVSTSTERQCVGFQLNTNSSIHGQWVTYDCFKPVSNAVFVCEYKCNSAVWPKTNVTNFMIGEQLNTTTQAPVPTTKKSQESTVKPDNNSGRPCKGAPPRCYPIGYNRAGTTCITSAETASGFNWYQMEAMCKQNNGRLVWLKEDSDINHLLGTSVNRIHVHGVLIATGLLSPTGQCVGFQLNANSTIHGQWFTYECFKPVSNAVFVCEYKCNTASWPKANLTNIIIRNLTTTTTTTTTTATTTTPVPTTKKSPGSSVTPDTNSGGPCRGSPPRCYPTGDIKAGTTCITTAEIGTGTNWYQMENVCKRNNGRLVWLREDLDLEHLLYTSVKHIHLHGALVATGLLSSTADSAGLFWRNPSDYTTFECCNTVTKPCLKNSTAETCTATGCCWTNGQCQYPQNQTLSTFNANTSQMKVSTSTERQCVGFQLNANSSIHGQWVTYECSKPASNAVFVCEYKCNTAMWPKTNVTYLMIGHTTTQAPTPVTVTPQGTVSSVKPDRHPQTPDTGTSQGTGSNVKPGTHPQPPDNGSLQGTGSGSSVKPVTVRPHGSNCDNKSVSAIGGPPQGSNVKPANNSFLKVLLSLETGGANTNMSFSLEQKLP